FTNVRPHLRRARTAGAILALAWLALPGAARAQLSARPTLLAFDEATDRVVTVRNEGPTAIQVHILPGDFDQFETGGHEFRPFGEHPRTCHGRLEVTPDQAVIDPGAETTVRVRLDPGAQACWGVVYAEHRPEPVAGAARAVRRIAIQVHGTPATIERDARVRDVEVAGGVIRFSFENLADAHLRPEGRVEFRTLDGGLVGNVRVEPFGVLPGHTRTMRFPLPAGLPAGELLAVPILDFGVDWLAGGQAMFEHEG
ncbi:MAG TPA: hypothetical protein VM778_02905, partial [Gemmatimonadota bacterium]|nr:hypothetical protein [Gemmatimonadota bacterium]